MQKIKWGLWKRTFPKKCSECGHISNRTIYIGSKKTVYCENCGSENAMIKTTKKDFKEMYKKLGLKNG